MRTSHFLFGWIVWIGIGHLFGQQEAITSEGKKVVLKSDGTWTWGGKNSSFSTPENIELPALEPEDSCIVHLAYSLVYSEPHEQAKWVAYTLTAEETIKKAERSDRFMVDPKVITGTATNADYKNSGYDRGHLAPAADMSWDQRVMNESFYFSNMSPQTPSFNRGIWKKLEEQVRNWAIENDSLHIVTGPVLTDHLPTIGNNKVAVPAYFYKVVMVYNDSIAKSIGFILPNEGSSNDLQTFAVSVDSVENYTGIDFFPALPDFFESTIEAQQCLSCWTWGNTPQQQNTNNASDERAQLCQGRTQKGAQCKNTTRDPSGYCHLHKK